MIYIIYTYIYVHLCLHTGIHQLSGHSVAHHSCFHDVKELVIKTVIPLGDLKWGPKM